MDEREYQQVRERLNQCPCVFEKAILTNRCGCEKCQRLNLAERELATCTSPTAQQRCIELLDQLYQNARFALKQPHLTAPLPHGKVMKVQCGGLLGLQTLLFSESNTTQPAVGNIDALITQALETYGDLKKLPYQEVVKFISHYQVRKSTINYQ
ncbi:MAG: hypothetical protein VSS75_009730 [Candidatus Parabeggiatoa sp.]|nr:hypothetical protein [Candidatus Parabeggiatoa sp.]